jgi:hypothetical protein
MCRIRVGAGSILACALVAWGCGTKEQRVPVFPVKGRVLVGGKPAVRATVIFHPKAAAADALAEQAPPRPSGEVQADGSFTLSTYTAGDGAPAGDYRVTISWPSGSSPIGGDADSGPDRLGGRYLNPQTSPLSATVKSAATEVPRFELK